VFVPFDRGVRVNLGVVALGRPQRLHDCLDALVTHESRHDFTVGCVVNDVGPWEDPVNQGRPLPEGVLVEPAAGNLGWAGGLHRARSLSDAELFVWVQEDMTPEPGWLDALVHAADTHPEVGAFGSVHVGEAGEVLLTNAGDATPPDRVEQWNATDRTLVHLPSDVTAYDWVTSKGLLTRTAVFDEVGGPDPRLYPLNHVDKDFSTHVRCHGWDVALVPTARLRHRGSQAAPSAFRHFLVQWRDPWFNDRWADSVARLAGASSQKIDHPCAEWRELTAGAMEAAVGVEASRMLVPMARERARAEAAFAAQQAARADALSEALAHAQQQAADAMQMFEDMNSQARALGAERTQLARRVRRLRRERDAARAAVAAHEERAAAGLAGRVREVVRRARRR
jgi:GT2 family glycosyltransferase